MRNKKKIIARLIILLVIVILGATGVMVFGFLKIDEAKRQIEALTTQIGENSQMAYIATRDIEPGELIYDEQTAPEGTVCNVVKTQIMTGLTAENYITAEKMGYEAVVPIKASVPVQNNMVCEFVIGNDTRLYEISAATLMTTQNEHDYIDVRILYPNGEDYIVLSKKQVKDLTLENCIFNSYLSEDEILTYSSAIIDAYTVAGTKLYTTKYIESNLQKEAEVNYPVKAETINLMNSDPNIVRVASASLNLQARNDLERRLANISEEQMAAVAAGNGTGNNSKNAALTGSVSDTSTEANENTYYEEN